MNEHETKRQKPGAALVTGGARRIGREIACMLAATGWPVVIHYNTSRTEAEDAAEAIRKTGGRAMTLQADLTDAEATAALVPAAAKAIGASIGCLINNASAFENDSPTRFEPTDFDRNMAIHARAPAQLAAAMAEQKPAVADGVVINLLDRKSYNPDPGFFSYAVSKYALRGLTEILAKSLAPHIRVNAVALGLVLPPASMSAARAAELGQKTLLGRAADLADVLEAVRFLIEAESVTGQVMHIDSGERLA